MQLHYVALATTGCEREDSYVVFDPAQKVGIEGWRRIDLEVVQKKAQTDITAPFIPRRAAQQAQRSTEY